VVDAVFGELLPKLGLEGGYLKRFRGSEGINDRDSLEVRGVLNVPLYQGGLVKARVRQAKHEHVRRIQEVAQERTEVRELAISAWAELRARRAKLRSDKTSVEANQIALAGVREEEKVGQRTLLDVLNAEQELLNSQVTLVETERDLVVSAYGLIAAIGRLTSKELGLTRKVYDAEAHYFDVRRKWFGISITHQDGRQEHVNVWKSHGEGRTYK
jgi:outer membrane protein